MAKSSNLSMCPICGGALKPFGVMRHRFVAEDLGGTEICIECARKVAPMQVAAAEEMEQKWASEQGS